MRRLLIFISMLIAFCESYRNDQHHHHHQPADNFNTGIKSYGGYFHDAGQNQEATNFVSTQNYQQPAVTSYQPYGWNFNQPSRTYGGVNYLQSRVDNNGASVAASAGTSNGNIGWVHGNNNYNSMQANPYFPKFPQMPFNPFPQFQFPAFPFPNFMPYPNVYNNQPNYHQTYPQQPNYQPPYPQQPLHPMPYQPNPSVNNVRPTNPNDFDQSQRPIPPQSTVPQGTQTSTLNHRVDQENIGGSGHFPTDSFFASTDNREWTQDQESRWQATTKAPFFENTVPGLGCTLPAASILGAKDVFSAIDLLPLAVPSGKPILSCNATGLKQTQVKIGDKIYSCSDGIMNVQCLEGNYPDSNSCPGRILICDMGSSKDITCTNGTLVSNSDLNCGSISLGNPRSTLNCELNQANLDLDYIPPDTTTRAPMIRPTRRSTTTEAPAPVTEYNDDDEFQTEIKNIDRIDVLPVNLNENELMPQVKKALVNVFPHDLLVKPSTRLLPPPSYLPPFETSASRDLKEVMNGVFPMNLLVITKGSESPSTSSSFDVRVSSDGDQQTVTRVVGANQPNRNVNEIGFKTQLSGAGIDTRFGGNQQQQPQQDFRDRLIFSN